MEEGSIRDTDLDLVAHEMAHAYDRDQRNTADDEYPNTANDPSEIRAVFFENLARKTEKNQKATMRIRYGDQLIDQKKLKDQPKINFKHEEYKFCPYYVVCLFV